MIKKTYIPFFILCSMSWAQNLDSIPQNQTTLDTNSNSSSQSSLLSRTSFVPVLAVAPETGLQYGLLTIIKTGAKDSDPSRIEIASVMSLEQQFKTILYADQYKDPWHLQNTLEYRLWPTRYYKSTESGEFREPKGSYDVSSYEYDGSAEKILSKGFYSGVGWNIKQQNIEWNDPKITPRDFPDLGQIGGLISGPKILFTLDQRDHVLEPTKGYYSAWISKIYSGITFSDFEFQKHSLDLRYFKTIIPKLVWGANVYGEWAVGDVPFFALPVNDGFQKLRGVDKGMILGRKYLSAQAELRFPLFVQKDWAFGSRVWNHLNGVVFADGAWAGSSGSSMLHNWLPAMGFGLRWALSTASKTFIRADFAYADHTVTPVVYIREAF